MKKTAFLTAALLLCTATGFAYENPAAGYSIKDKAPILKLESQKMYAFTDLPSNSIAKLGDTQQGSMHVINYFTAEEMSKSLEEPFSTAYFDAEYEKLALMQRSQLDMRTVPLPILELNKYGSTEEAKGNLLLQKELVKKELLDAKPRLRIDKIGKFKVITESYLLKQADGLVAMDTSILSANDKLYMLSTITTDNAYYAANKEDESADTKEEEKASAKLEEQNDDQSDVKGLPDLEPVAWQSLPEELRNSLWQKHVQLVKGFKVLPICNCLPVLRYQDDVSHKNVLLPQDWFYGQLNLREKEGSFCVTMAASLKNMRQIAAEMDYLGILELAAKEDEQNPAKVVLDAPTNKVLPTTVDLSPAAQSKLMEESRKALSNFDAILMSASFAIKDKELNDFILGTTENQLAAQVMLEETLAGLKRSDNQYFKLNDYNYNLDFNELRETATVNANITLLQDFIYDNLLTLTMKGSSGTALWYLHKPDYEANTELSNSIKEWQF